MVPFMLRLLQDKSEIVTVELTVHMLWKIFLLGFYGDFWSRTRQFFLTSMKLYFTIRNLNRPAQPYINDFLKSDFPKQMYRSESSVLDSVYLFFYQKKANHQSLQCECENHIYRNKLKSRAPNSWPEMRILCIDPSASVSCTEWFGLCESVPL